MANRRTLKKGIQLVTSDLITESYINYLMLKKMDNAGFDAIVEKIADINNDFLAKCIKKQKGFARLRTKPFCNTKTNHIGWFIYSVFR